MPVASPRGYFGVGIVGGKSPENVGGLWRSAHAFGAAMIFTIAFRSPRQATDTTKATRHVPLFTWPDWDAFMTWRDHAQPSAEAAPDAVEWGEYATAIARWEGIVGSAPEPLVRRVDDRSAARVERSRLSALGDGVQVQLGRMVGEYLLDLDAAAHGVAAAGALG